MHTIRSNVTEEIYKNMNDIIKKEISIDNPVRASLTSADVSNNQEKVIVPDIAELNNNNKNEDGEAPI